MVFDYSTAAALYVQKRGGRGQTYRSFKTAAEAIRFVMEELPAESLKMMAMEVGDDRLNGNDIERLYRSTDFPLQIGETKRTTKPR
jgi:hypothetical protein